MARRHHQWLDRLASALLVFGFISFILGGWLLAENERLGLGNIPTLMMVIPVIAYGVFRLGVVLGEQSERQRAEWRARDAEAIHVDEEES